MMTSDNPPTDFKLCLFCQTDTCEKLVDTQYRTFKESAYESFLSCVYKKSDYCNPEFVVVAKRLKGTSADELKAKKASWHRDCYKKTVSHLDRDARRNKLAIASKDASILINKKRGRPSSVPTDPAPKPKNTRLSVSLFDRTKCVFCQPTKQDEEEPKEQEKLQQCLTTSMGARIQEIFCKSKQDAWKVRLADVLSSGDLLSRDILYHHTCFTKNWEKYIQRPCRRAKSVENSERIIKPTQSVSFLAAEVEFFSVLQEQVDQGQYIAIAELEERYHKVLHKFGISDYKVTRGAFKESILKNVQNVVVTPSYGKRPSHVHSSDAQKAAINAAVSSQNMGARAGRLKDLYLSAKELRSIVQTKVQEDPWRFNGSLKDCVGDGVPCELLFFITWVLQGTTDVQTDRRAEDMTRSSNLICQQIMSTRLFHSQ